MLICLLPELMLFAIPIMIFVPQNFIHCLLIVFAFANIKFLIHVVAKDIVSVNGNGLIVSNEPL